MTRFTPSPVETKVHLAGVSVSMAIGTSLEPADVESPFPASILLRGAGLMALVTTEIDMLPPQGEMSRVMVEPILCHCGETLGGMAVITCVLQSSAVRIRMACLTRIKLKLDIADCFWRLGGRCVTFLALDQCMFPCEVVAGLTVIEAVRRFPMLCGMTRLTLFLELSAVNVFVAGGTRLRETKPCAGQPFRGNVSKVRCGHMLR